ncbi:hypothetical protein [Pedosphaera parvula]|uniref:Transglutaminase-like domain-containing protein n=1 Tax=Pedosphaera parvula (strain Ellin514) TaxID=320771 RepID=B9XB54_PEDPL|nr:hypothetical protein [Pedosphaera parvula]EEF62739.1 hypothetical protein Cflav_PD5374 [Pedosphaera parvula Ellin514]
MTQIRDLLHRRLASLVILAIILPFLAHPLHAVTFQELQADKNLTPESLMRRLAHFKFRLTADLQPRDQFLASETGDCDDFATLAADVLKAKGFTTQLIAVHMEKQFHVVCYVKEVNAYLDYNNRKKPSPLVSTDGSLDDIADKVAHSFRTPWSTVAEFIYNAGVRRVIALDFCQRNG